MTGITHELVLEVLEGCAEHALAEAKELGPARPVTPTEISLHTEDLDAVRSLRRAVAASTALTVPARRPRELLETSVQQRLGTLLEEIRRQRPRQRFHGLRLEAAGAHTPEMRRLAEALGALSGLPVDEDGDLVVRVRRGRTPETWQVLLRTTPRPLATRAWRTVNYPGAVNATIAASVLDRLQVGAEDSMLDMTCGSGTFLVEQLHVVAPRRAVGVDRDPAAIDAARAHQRGARRRGRIEWLTGDVLTVPLEGGFTRLVTNPPWGTLHGDHESNEELLALLLRRAAELAAPGARLGVLTHEITRMHRVLDSSPAGWRTLDEHRFFQKGHHPRLFLLARD
ncbi:methyltransferase [Brachybacterium saurashtrense]|uniref:Methyltransferase domain-containing protein n=1 Tax=Brachybacterium saurashtrense TaxID=556288 RepID=A0A345YMD2_9MICO|nr:methyltransferase [Brachybacterium saurashtrense]AXK45084.1 methyltransferase domain-containing protein [Brachybacterium saurashtrense]RRR21768.1 methyltransferase domain-containing protein [Brachybacterium saurashtrense]